MISWRALLDGAQPMSVDAVDAGFLDRVIVGLHGVKLRPQGSHAFRYPRHVDQLEHVRHAIEEAMDKSALEAHALAGVLRRPLRVYPLAQSRGYALLGAFRIDDVIEPRIVVVVNSTEGIVIDAATFDVGVSHEDLLAAMERVYANLDPAARQCADPTRGPRDRVLWIGGSEAETSDANWRIRIEAVLMTEGYTAVLLERPGRDPVATARAISEVSACAVVEWVPRLGNPRLVHEITDRSQVRVIELMEYAFDDALEELRLELESVPLASIDERDEAGDEVVEIEPGHAYYFKKTGKRGQADRVVHRRHPCNHDSWRGAPGAPQARKGIERLTGRTIRTLEHCNQCTGGGMWRVTFD